jgi:hypothetical protein
MASWVSRGLFKTLHFVNEIIFRNTKQDTIEKAGVITIAVANIRHAIRFMTKRPLKLVYPNEVL